MNLDNIKTNIRRFFSNPNTLTFVLVIFLIIVIYFVYSTMVKNAVKPVNVPYCTETLKTLTEITDQQIGSVQITGNFVSANGSGLIQQVRQVKNKYVSPKYIIPENSFFYQEAVSDSSIAETTPVSGIPNNYAVFELGGMDFHKTYGCSIMSGNYIDLYFKGMDKENESKLIFERFITSIQVLRVIDSKGLDVFTESTEEEPKPSAIWFAVPTEYYELLQYAVSMDNVEIVVVPRNSQYTENPEPTRIDNTAVESYILQYASSKR